MFILLPYFAFLSGFDCLISGTRESLPFPILKKQGLFFIRSAAFFPDIIIPIVCTRSLPLQTPLGVGEPKAHLRHIPYDVLV